MCFRCFITLSLFVELSGALAAQEQRKPYNVLFIISDDLTATALGCYGSTCKTPHIDKLASEGVRFTRAYCQATFCGPSRASMMFGYYPYASKANGYTSGREKVGPNKESWPQYFKHRGYHSARISKVFHMGVPPDIGKGSDGADDPASWDEAYNSKGPESKAPGIGETLQNNPGDKKKGAGGGNHFVVVEAEGDDFVHSDGKTAQKAAELITRYKDLDKPFFLAVGFVRPHVPFVAPKTYFAPYKAEKMVLPPKIPGDQDDIPRNPANRRTSANYKMDIGQQKRLIRGYYASVSYMDAMVGKVIKTLEESGQRDRTIVIFTSDHGYHLGEHDMWSKVSIHKESAQVPLIICVPGKKPAVCRSFVELLDLYPTISGLCGLKIPGNVQGKDISRLLDNPVAKVRDAVLSSGKGLLYREERWAYLHYGNSAELYDMKNDPKQYTNLVGNPEYAPILTEMGHKLNAKLAEIRKNDLGEN